MNEEELKEKYLHFKMLQQHIEQLNGQLELLNQQAAELEISQNAVAEVGKTPVQNEILAAVANGIFIKAKLENNQKFIVNVGSSVTVEKTVEEVIKLLELQIAETAERIIEAEALLQQLSQQAMAVYQEVEKHVQQTEE